MAHGRTNLQASKTFLSFLSQKITLLDLKKKSRYISKFSSGFKTDNYGVQGDKTDKKCRRRIRSLLQLLRRHDRRSHCHLFWIRITDVETYENKTVMYFWIVQCVWNQWKDSCSDRLLKWLKSGTENLDFRFSCSRMRPDVATANLMCAFCQIDTFVGF